jgi:hypothetical protein
MRIHHFYHQFFFGFLIFNTDVLPFHFVAHKNANEKADGAFGFGKFLW